MVCLLGIVINIGHHRQQLAKKFFEYIGIYYYCYQNLAINTKLILSMVKQKKLLRFEADGAVAANKVHGVPIISSSMKKRTRGKRFLRAQALRMLSQKRADVDAEGIEGSSSGNDSGAITPGSISNGEGSKEFLSTGRTGRRNAMPDILGQHADTGTADLPSRLEALTTDSHHDEASTSGITVQNAPSTSQQG